MRIFLKRNLWLAGVLVAGLSLTGCSGGDGEVEDPLEDGEELAEDDIDSALEDMDSEAGYDAEPMDDYNSGDLADDSADPMDDNYMAEEAQDADDAAMDAEEMVGDMEDNSEELVEQLDTVDQEDVDNYKLDEDTAMEDDSYASETEPMPEVNEPAMDDSADMMDEPAYADNSPAASDSQVRYIARPGDTLGNIAYRAFGDLSRWRDLASTNGITDPSSIYPGDVILIDVNDDTRGFANELSQAQMETVVVESGDTLSSISQRVLGDGEAWKYIWRFNEDRVSNPDFITVGQVLSYVPVNNATGIAKAGEDSTVR